MAQVNHPAAFWRSKEVVGVRSGQVSGEMEGGDLGADYLFGDESEKDGGAAPFLEFPQFFRRCSSNLVIINET
ncbi:MAG: hypothetical protein GTO13_16705 [Proteobacteria bacterium]|nr:hypothetical protein [Pseudomonadota bacterium]